MPQRWDARKQQPVLNQTQERDAEQRAEQAATAARHARPAQDHGRHGFQRERAPDRRRDIAIGRDIEGRRHAAEAAADEESDEAGPQDRDAGQPRPLLRVADAEEVRPERHAPERDAGDGVDSHDDEERHGHAERLRAEEERQVPGKARQPGAAQHQEDGGAIDAEQAERADDRRHAPEHHDRGRDGAQESSDDRPEETRQRRRPAGLKRTPHGHGREAHDDPDRDVDAAHGKQQGHSETDEQQLLAGPEDRQEIVGGREARRCDRERDGGGQASGE